MAVPYEKIVEEDLNLGTSTATVTMPAGGTATGHQINPATFPALTFAATAPGTQTTAGSATVSLTTEVFDTKSWFTASTFTPLKAGYYAFQSNLTFTAACTVTICKNGVAFVTATLAAAGSISLGGLNSSNGVTDTFTLVVNGTGTVSSARFSGVCVGGL